MIGSTAWSTVSFGASVTVSSGNALIMLDLSIRQSLRVHKVLGMKL